MNNERRRKIQHLIGNLEDILAEEDESRENMPENLIGSQRYEDSEEASGFIQDAIDSLNEIT